MTNNQYQKDIIFLVADKNAKFAVQGLLSRHQSLQIRLPKNDIYIHPEKDSGCLLRSHDLLRPFINQYAFSLVIFDREGCGQENSSRQQLENHLETLLGHNGWGNRTSVIVIDPELDNWVWSDSPHVDTLLGWSGRQPNLRTWLMENGFLTAPNTKPSRPKEAMEAALRKVYTARSSSIYQLLAERVSLSRCVDPAFTKLKATLRNWFPQ
jgi:hypothetical protein